MFIIYGSKCIGKKNLQVRSGRCGHCGELVELENYDTRAWATLMFIPVLPLDRRKVLDFCPSCKHSKMMPTKKYEKHLKGIVGPLRDRAAAAPNDSNAALELLFALEAWGQREEAVQLARDISGRFAGNASAQLALAEYHDSTDNSSAASTARNTAKALDPDHPFFQQDDIANAINTGDLAGAHALLETQDCDTKPAPELLIALAEAYQEQQEHDKAVEVFGWVLEVEPTLSKQAAFRKMVSKSEKFAMTGRSILPGLPLLKRKKFWAAAAAIAVIALVGANFYAARHRKLYVVNGLFGDISISIDGDEPFTVCPGESKVISVSDGSHEAKATTAVGRTDLINFSVSGDISSSFFGKDVRVLNPFGAGAIGWEKVAYIEKTSSRKAPAPKHRLHAGRRYMEFEGIDHPFEDLPEKVDLKSQRDTAFRTSVSVVVLPPGQILNITADLVSTDDLLGFAEAHILDRPDDLVLLTNYVNLSSSTGKSMRALEFMAPRLADRPLRMDWHRAYQNLGEKSGRREELAAYYRKLLDEEPNSAQRIYLMSRLMGAVNDKLKLDDRAIAADKTFPYAWLSKSYCLMAMGQFDQALKTAEEGCRLAPDHLVFIGMLETAQFAAGEMQNLIDIRRAALEQNPLDMVSLINLQTILARAGRWSEAKQAQAAYAKAARKVANTEDRKQLIASCQLHLMTLQGMYEKVFSEADNLKNKKLKRRMKLNACINLGRVGEAVRWARRIPDLAWQYDLLLSMILREAGRTDDASEQMAKVIKKLASQGASQVLMAEVLAKPLLSSANARQIAAEPQDKALVLVAAVQVGADKNLLNLAEKLNYDFGFMHHALKGRIAKLRARR